MINIIGTIDEAMANKVCSELTAEVEKDMDIIHIRLNSTGGYVYDALAIADYIEELKEVGKNIIIHCSGAVMSASTIILMSASEVVVSRAIFMFHLSSCRFEGNSETLREEQRTQEWADKHLRSAAGFFLNPDEIFMFEKGSSIYKELTSNQINRALKIINGINEPCFSDEVEL